MDNQQMEHAKPEEGVARKPRNGALVFYRANGRGTGMAVRFELRINRAGEDTYNCFFLEMAHQKADAGEGRRHASFDWANKVIVKLEFMDVCELLSVLEGTRPQAGNGQNGIYHETPGANTLISFKKSPDAQGGYHLGVSKKKKGGEQAFRGSMILSEQEALGLRCVMQSSLFFMVFSSNIRRG